VLQDKEVTQDHKPQSEGHQDVTQSYDDKWQESESESEPHQDDKPQYEKNWLVDVSMKQITLWLLFSRIMLLFLNYYIISILYLVSVFSLFC
jgi:sugar phosphate permease